MDTAPKVTLTSGVSKEEEDDNMIMLLLSNESLYGCLAAPCSMSMLSESCHVSCVAEQNAAILKNLVITMILL